MNLDTSLPPLLGIIEGSRLRDAGIQRALDNSGDWKALAEIELEQIWKDRRTEGNEFTFEMLKAPIVRTVGMPKNQNCWGGLAQRAVKNGWLKFTGKICNSSSVTRHAGTARIYVWGVA